MYQRQRSRMEYIPSICEDAPWAEETCPYFARTNRRLAFTEKDDVEPEDPKKKIDMIPKELVAGIRTEKIHTAVKNEIFFTSALTPALRFLLPDSNPDKASPPPNEPEEMLAAKKEKNIEERPVAPTLTTTMSAAIRALWKQSELFEQYKRSDGPIRAYVSGFLVPKPSGVYRVIIDARWSNVFFNKKSAHFNIFTLSSLRHVIDNLSINNQTWYAGNFDLRHQFLQIPFPDRYKPYFAVPLTDRGNNWGDIFIVPRASPMGFNYSPLGGQAVAASLVLLPSKFVRENKDKGMLGRHYDSVYKTSLQKQNTPFSFIPLKNNNNNNIGGIFIILDNALIVCSDKKNREILV
mgnify:CR=1 FL=1